jgi:hypothetical protein
MRAILLNSQIVKILTFSMLIIPRPALSDADLGVRIRRGDTSIRGVLDEVDPEDEADCLSMGELDIFFRTDNYGPLNVGVLLTDPRGRRVGFDPLTKKAWQALPVALGYIDCDDLDGANACQGIVQVCGPVSGTYKLEVIAQQTTAYSVSVSARSKEVLNRQSLQSSRSVANLNHVGIRSRSRNIVLLHYSRDYQAKITAHLQHSPHTPSNEARFHREGAETARTK